MKTCIRFIVLLVAVMFGILCAGCILSATEEPTEQIISATITKIDVVKDGNSLFVAGIASEEFSGTVYMTPEQYAKLNVGDTVMVHILKYDTYNRSYIEEYNPEHTQFPFIR